MHLVNLFLAGIWLALGVCLFGYEQLVPAAGTPKIPYLNISYGWIAIGMAGYNILRWWRRRRSWRAEMERKESQRRAELACRDREFQASGRERDPNFIFDEPPEPRTK